MMMMLMMIEVLKNVDKKFNDSDTVENMLLI